MTLPSLLSMLKVLSRLLSGCKSTTLVVVSTLMGPSSVAPGTKTPLSVVGLTHLPSLQATLPLLLPSSRIRGTQRLHTGGVKRCQLWWAICSMLKS